MGKGIRRCVVCGKEFFCYHYSRRRTCSFLCKCKYLSDLFSSEKYRDKFLRWAKLGGLLSYLKRRRGKR